MKRKYVKIKPMDSNYFEIPDVKFMDEPIQITVTPPEDKGHPNSVGIRARCWIHICGGGDIDNSLMRYSTGYFRIEDSKIYSSREEIIRDLRKGKIKRALLEEVKKGSYDLSW